MTSDIYNLRNVAFHYGGKTALVIDELAIQTSSIVGLMGPNGSGKSTLLKLLAFVERPSGGQILFDGKPAAPFSKKVRFHVTLLTQSPYLMKRSVFENISYGLKLRGRNDNLKKRVLEALSMVGLAPEFAERSWRELSGGEAQRTALAARLALEPKVLLLDEPTASVDAISGQYIREASLSARRRWGTTLVIASHDLQWLYGTCDQTFHLYNGVIFGNGFETILFGPWSRKSEKFWTKSLGDSQRIVVTSPPSPDAAAVLAREKLILLDSQSSASHDNCLKGMISRLIYKKSADEIVGSVVAGNMPFTFKTSQEKIARMGLYPGKEIYVAFSSTDLIWIDA